MLLLNSIIYNNNRESHVLKELSKFYTSFNLAIEDWFIEMLYGYIGPSEL